MKPTKTFKLSKPVKRVLASMSSKEERSQYKSLMIDAELTFEANQKRNFRKEKDTEE
jgi:hypothetical protein